MKKIYNTPVCEMHMVRVHTYMAAVSIDELATDGTSQGDGEEDLAKNIGIWDNEDELIW